MESLKKELFSVYSHTKIQQHETYTKQFDFFALGGRLPCFLWTCFCLYGAASSDLFGLPAAGSIGRIYFFSISGYLIAQSWDNDPNPYRYITRRALRIFPALIANTVLTVFIIGPLFTSLSLSKYFSNSQTWGYFSNIFLYNTYSLPGVFEHNTYPNAINGSLITYGVLYAEKYFSHEKLSFKIL